MALARMALTNYRGFASRQSIELRPITVVLGRNNAGKSALVRAPVILAGGIHTDSQEPVDIDKISEELLESFADLIHGGPAGDSRIGVEIGVQADGLARLVASIRHLPEQHREVVQSLELFDAGRFTLIASAPFAYGTTEQRTAWRSLIATLEAMLRLHQHGPGTLVALDEYLYRRSSGMIGSLSQLIRGAAILAIEDGTEQITRDLLDLVPVDFAAEKAARPTTPRQRKHRTAKSAAASA